MCDNGSASCVWVSMGLYSVCGCQWVCIVCVGVNGSASCVWVSMGLHSARVCQCDCIACVCQWVGIVRVCQWF